MRAKFPYADHEKLRDAWRRSHIDPDAFWRDMRLEAGMRVLDVGCGIGYFAIPAARTVGPQGRVWACDVATEMVAHLRREGAGLPQLEGVVSEETRLPLPDGVADLALAAFVLHELEKPASLLKEAARVLKTGGRLLILDWLPGADEPADYPRWRRYGPATIRCYARQGGFVPFRARQLNEANFLVEALKRSP